MNIYDYIILGVVFVCLTAAIIFIIRRKVKGKSVCCGCCEGCSCSCKNKK